MLIHNLRPKIRQLAAYDEMERFLQQPSEEHAQAISTMSGSVHIPGLLCCHSKHNYNFISYVSEWMLEDNVAADTIVDMLQKALDYRFRIDEFTGADESSRLQAVEKVHPYLPLLPNIHAHAPVTIAVKFAAPFLSLVSVEAGSCLAHAWTVTAVAISNVLIMSGMSFNAS